MLLQEVVFLYLLKSLQVEASATKQDSPHSLGHDLGTAEKCQLCKQPETCYQQKYN